MHGSFLHPKITQIPISQHVYNKGPVITYHRGGGGGGDGDGGEVGGWLGVGEKQGYNSGKSGKF